MGLAVDQDNVHEIAGQILGSKGGNDYGTYKTAAEEFHTKAAKANLDMIKNAKGFLSKAKIDMISVVIESCIGTGSTIKDSLDKKLNTLLNGSVS